MRLIRPRFEFTARFPINASPELIWTRLGRTDLYGTWWPWLRGLRSDGLVTDGTTRGWLRTPLGYRISFDVLITEADEPKHLVAMVGGDVEGVAELHLTPEGAGTQLVLSFLAEVRRPLLRVLSGPAHGLLAWGHDHMVSRAVRDFERHLPPGA